MSNQTHTIEATLPDCFKFGSTYIHGEADVDAAGAVSLLDAIRADLDDKATIGRSYDSAPPSITYRHRGELDGSGDVVVLIKLPNAEPAGKPEPEDVEALLRRAADEDVVDAEVVD